MGLHLSSEKPIIMRQDQGISFDTLISDLDTWAKIRATNQITND